MVDKEKNKLAVIGNSLKANEKRIAAKLGGMIKWEYFCSAFLTMVEKNPTLAECTEASLVRAVLDAAQLRLMPDGVLGEAYIVPYGRTATLIVGYKGLIQLCLRSGSVKKIGARIVYQNDFFQYEYGMNEACKHIPAEENPGKVRGCYATFEMSGGVKGFEYWSYEKVMDHKIKFAKGLDKKDKYGNFTSPWRTNEEAMIFKTLIRAIIKILPKSIEELVVANAIESQVDFDLEDAIYVGLTKKEAKEAAEKSGAALDAGNSKIVNTKIVEPSLSDVDAVPTKEQLESEDAAIKADNSAANEDDIPIGDSPETLTPDEVKEFRKLSASLKVPTATLVVYLSKNNWKDIKDIPRSKFEQAKDGLRIQVDK